jgi:hypothetical protein
VDEFGYVGVFFPDESTMINESPTESEARKMASAPRASCFMGRRATANGGKLPRHFQSFWEKCRSYFKIAFLNEIAITAEALASQYVVKRTGRSRSSPRSNVNISSSF